MHFLIHLFLGISRKYADDYFSTMDSILLEYLEYIRIH